MQIDGIGAIVTGGGSGLGAATARVLAEKGARVTVLDRDADRAQAVAVEIGGQGIAVDVTDADAVGRAVEKAAARAPLRLCVNCAGIGLAARIVGRDGTLSLDLFETVLKVNLFGTYTVMSHAARAMMALDPLDTTERGVIVNTASAAWQDGQIGQAAYAASKGAIAAMCLPAARELARAGIRVMAIAPGLFETPMMEGLPEETVAGITANIPFPARLGRPEEFGRMVVQIAESTYLNGTTIRLDGAVRLPPR